MLNEENLNRASLLEQFTSTSKRLEENESVVGAGSKKGWNHLSIGGVFDDALMAADLACALGEPDTQIKTFLAKAADAAVQLFRSRETLERKITYLPSGKEDTFFDTSMTNQFTFVQAVYAALAANRSEALTYYATLAPERYRSDKVIVSQILDKYSRALSQVIAGNSHAATVSLRNILTGVGRIPEAGDQYWLAQAQALNSLIGRDTSGFHEALQQVLDVEITFYNEPNHRDEPGRFLALPVLGLRALHKQIGLAGD